jgi:hypothetical protein
VRLRIPFAEGVRMPIVTFGKRVLDPQQSTFTETVLVLRDMPRRYKTCDVDIVMRGASADFEDWIAVRIASVDKALEESCVDWLMKQMSRRGCALVPRG